MTPRASVLVPVFNAAETIALCLRSIFRQTEPDIEVLLVDDGSTDDTVAIAHRADDRRLRIVRRDHEGLVATLNAGLDEARADVVVRMDADDVMHRERIALQLEALAAAPVAAVGCHVRLFPRRTLTDGLRAYERWLNSLTSPSDVARDRWIECPIAHPTLTARTDVLRELRYRDAGWPEDYDLVLRMFHAGSSIGVVPKRLVMWRDHPERLSRTHDRYRLERFTACRAHHLARSFVTGDRYVLWGFGHTGKALRRALADEGKRVAAIVELHPGRVGQVIHGAPVIRPERLVEHRAQPVLVSVAGEVARRQIRAAMHEMAFVEGRDFVCCA